MLKAEFEEVERIAARIFRENARDLIKKIEDLEKEIGKLKLAKVSTAKFTGKKGKEA